MTQVLVGEEEISDFLWEVHANHHCREWGNFESITFYYPHRDSHPPQGWSYAARTSHTNPFQKTAEIFFDGSPVWTLEGQGSIVIPEQYLEEGVEEYPIDHPATGFMMSRYCFILAAHKIDREQWNQPPIVGPKSYESVFSCARMDYSNDLEGTVKKFKGTEKVVFTHDRPDRDPITVYEFSYRGGILQP